MPFDADNPATSRAPHGLHSAFDRAYLTCPHHVRRRPLREQSAEILRLAAMACGMVPAHWMLDSTERAMVEQMGAMAHHPLQLEAFIAETHAAFPDDDFSAARLDPEARRGWPPAASGEEARIERHPPWGEPTDDLTADLRAGSQHLTGEALHVRIKDDIRALPASFAVPNSGADPRTHDMMPVTVAAFYLYCLEERIRELEGRMPHAKP